MADGSLSVSGSVTGLLTGTKTIGPITVSTTSPEPATTQVVLASGANTITLPDTDVTAALIVFASASTVSKTLKGVTGDTGIVLDPNGFFLLTFDTTSPTNFVITAGAADTGNTTEILFI